MEIERLKSILLKNMVYMSKFLETVSFLMSIFVAAAEKTVVLSQYYGHASIFFSKF